MRKFSRIFFAAPLVAAALAVGGAPMASRRYVDRATNAVAETVRAHEVRRDNPHQVTAGQVGAVALDGRSRVGEDFFLSGASQGLSFELIPDYLLFFGGVNPFLSVYLAHDGVMIEGETADGIARRADIGHNGVEISRNAGGSIDIRSILWPDAVGAGDVFAVRGDIAAATNAVEARRGFHWDEEAGVLWRSQIRNGFLEVIAVTNRPLAEL